MANKKASNDKASEIGESVSKADALINSYLGDLFSTGADTDQSGADVTASDLSALSASVEEPSVDVQDSLADEIALSLQLKEALASATVERNRALISTVDPIAAARSKTMLNKPQSFLMLLISLYYLRRPLPEKVRQCFIDVSERMLDDYEASEWQAQIVPSSGVLSEARS